jgi:CubicO group peptidase (beta-lactamase class C family)
VSAICRIPWRSEALLHAAVLLLALLYVSEPAFGEALPPAKSPAYDLPVSVARDGIPANLAYLMRQGFTSTNAYYTGDRNLYYFLHWEEFVPHNLIRRAGALKTLDASPDDAIGKVRAESSLGEMSLDELIADPRARIQGFVVVHEGRILYERYPGMREEDHHLWFSVSKTVAGLLIGLLESEGSIDVRRPVAYYLPELASTHWERVPIIDILDMASGLDVEENEESRTNPSSTVNHFFRIELGDTSGLGQRTSDQILFSAGDKRPPGEAFEYSSLNTKMLGLVVERVTGQRLADVFSERVWSKIGAEGDAQVGVNLQGGAAVYGMISSRLRDMARYGMIYTPGWKAVSGERIVPQSLMDKIRNGCRPGIYRQGATARGRDDDPNSGIRCNSRQWDAIFVDGDMYKGGARGQGLYVSPDRDLVVAWFSTTSENGWMNYARAIATSLAPNP